jgi:hypothetical protein
LAVGATVAVVDGAGVVTGEVGVDAADAGAVTGELGVDVDGAGVDDAGVVGAVSGVQPLKATPSIKAAGIKAASIKAATVPCNGAFALTAAPSGPSNPRSWCGGFPLRPSVQSRCALGYPCRKQASRDGRLPVRSLTRSDRGLSSL